MIVYLQVFTKINGSTICVDQTMLCLRHQSLDNNAIHLELAGQEQEGLLVEKKEGRKKGGERGKKGAPCLHKSNFFGYCSSCCLISRFSI